LTEEEFMSEIDLRRSELAINGGKPVRTKPWLDNFTIGKEEKSAAMRVLDSGYLSLFEGSHHPDAPFSFYGGPEVRKLEQEWNEFYSVKYSVAMNSATSGLYAAIGALGVGYGDEVIVSPYTMTACALAPLIYGAIPVFADVDDESGCLDPKSVAALISERTKAILIVHQFGFPADMDSIMSLAKQHRLYVIEDCAQAHGAQYKGQAVGSIGDIGVFSLNVNKTIQTGEGAVCTTNNDELCYRLQLIRNHGEAVVGPSRYENITNIAGFNYRLTEIAAAMAREQLKKLPRLNFRRLALVEQLHAGLSELPFLKPLRTNEPGIKPTYYVCPIRFDELIAGVSREDFVRAINAEGLQFYQGYTRPLYLQPLYQEKRLYKHGYPFAAKENENCRTAYSRGTAPVAERLHFHEMLINEHIRPPQDENDIRDILSVIGKIASN
jgi:perosamine synthetase